MDFTVGLVALAVGLAFDFQRLIPAIGDRIAAVCALTVGSAWLAGGEVGGWFHTAATTGAGAVGTAAHGVTSDVPTSSGMQVAGIIVGWLFLLWLLAMLPGLSIIAKYASPNTANALTSGLIWIGVAFPPLIALVPGRWGDLATNLTFAGSRLGATVSGWIL